MARIKFPIPSRAPLYLPMFCESPVLPGNEGCALSQLCARGVDGIILHSELATEDLRSVLPPGYPLVVIRYAPTPGIPCVVADRSQAYADGVRWLAARGHRRIAFAGAFNRPAARAFPDTHQFKIQGYRAAMEQLGLFDPDLMLAVGLLPGQPREFVAAQGDRFADVTAVLCANDRMAIEVMVGLSELGRNVPRDCGVVGFDNTEFAMAVRPTLTSFDPRRGEVGVKAVDMLLDLIAGKAVRDVALPPVLVERESTAARF